MLSLAPEAVEAPTSIHAPTDAPAAAPAPALPAEWVDVPEGKVLLTPAECRALWKSFEVGSTPPDVFHFSGD